MTLFVFLFLSGFARGEVTEQEVMQHVLSSFPTVQMAQDDVKIAEGERKFSEGAFDLNLQSQYTQMTGNYEYDFLQTRVVKPTSLFGLDLYAGFRKSEGTIPIYDGNLETLSEGEWNVGARLPLLRGFLIDERRALYQKNQLLVQQREYQLRSTELDQVRASLHRYWDWRLSLQRISINKNLLKIAQLRDEWLAKRSKAGDIAGFERDDNRRTILQRQSILLQSEQFFRQSLSELEFYIESPELRERLEKADTTVKGFPLPTSVVSYFNNPDALVELAFKNRPEFKSLNIQKEQLRVDESLQSNRFLPQLDIEAQYSKDSGLGGTKLNDDNTKISLQLEIPLQYRRIRGRAEQIDSSISRVNNQSRLLAQRIRADIVITQKNLQVAMQRRELAQDELQLAQRLEAGERLRLKQGETNILMVNLREQASAEAEFRYAEASVEALKHYITLKTTVGELPYLK